MNYLLRKIKRVYIYLLFKPLRLIKLSLFYFYTRTSLFLSIRGIYLPGLKKVKKYLPKAALEAYERHVLIYEIKGERFFIRKGPLWLRKLFDKVLLICDRYRFLLLILLKTMVAVVIIAIPVFTFILIRGVLPVPDRVPYGAITIRLPERSNLRTDWLYTEAPFDEKINQSIPYFNYIDPNQGRGISITPVLEPKVPNGLIHFGIGYYPSRLYLMRGFIVGESSALIVQRQRNINMEVENGDKLRIQYYLFPSYDNNTHSCKIQIKDEKSNLLASTTETTPSKVYSRSEGPITQAWKQQFIPNSIPNFGTIREFIVNLRSYPKSISASVQDLNEPSSKKDDVSKKISPENLDQFKHNYKNISGHDLTTNNCVFSLGDFSIERTVINPPKRRGILFVLVDTLRVDTAYDKTLMPNLNKYAEQYGIKFMEHRAQGNMTVPSVVPLMTSHFAREIGPVAFTYAASTNEKSIFYNRQIPLMPSVMSQLGYRVGGIGWLSLFSEGLRGGVDLGFHNGVISEDELYEARQITERTGDWLEQYGDAPFFLYVHYNTMHGPYKPALSYINIPKLLARPLGLNQKKQLYDGLARYWDHEFLNLLQKLKELGILNDIDIIITADHGAQFKNQPWNYFMGVPQQLTGAYTDKGHTLFDEEVHIPLIMHLANGSALQSKVVNTPTAHIDLFPTLYDLAGGKTPDKNWKGIDLYPAIKENANSTIPLLTEKRDYIYFDGHEHAGLLYWGGLFKDHPKKYIRQFSLIKDLSLSLNHNPWQTKITWNQSEMYSSVDLKNHTETWLPSLSGNDLRLLREKYYELSPTKKVLNFIPKYTGTFNVLLNFNTESNIVAPYFILPEGLKVTHDLSNWTISGHVKLGDKFVVQLNGNILKSVSFPQGATPVLCATGVKIDENLIAKNIYENICSSQLTPDEIIHENYIASDKVVLIQKSLTGDQQENQVGTGAGEALQNALREWGYAK